MKHKYNVKAYKYKIIDIFESNFFDKKSYNF